VPVPLAALRFFLALRSTFPMPAAMASSRSRVACNGGVRYSNCRNARPGGGVQPPDSLPFLDALWKEPQAARTSQRADPASEGMTLEMRLVRQPPSGGAERYCDPTMTC
jgi:hypothetical protein